MKVLFKNKTIRIVCIILAFALMLGVISFLFEKPGTAESSTGVLETPTVNVNLTPENGYISFLGDSITTYDGWSNNASYNSTIGNNGVYYTSDKMPVYSTYWHKVASAFGMGLCVNNSWDGARVTDTKAGIPDGKTRAAQLHNDNKGISPDVIVINLGTNDLANGIGEDEFISAYKDMLDVIKADYPEATIFCCGILPESRNDDNGEIEKRLDYYNDALYELSDEYQFYFISPAYPFISWEYESDTFVDSSGLRVHPNVAGMNKLAKWIISEMKGKI